MAKKKNTNLPALIEHVEQAHDIAGKINSDEEMIVTLAGNTQGFGIVVDGSTTLIFDALTRAIESLTDEYDSESDYTFKGIIKTLTDIHKANEKLKSSVENSPEAIFGSGDKSDMS